MKNFLLLFLCFNTVASTTLLAQKIFKEGSLFFRNGEIKEVLVLEDSYQGYAKGVTYKNGKNGALQQAGFQDLEGFHIAKDQQFKAFTIQERFFRAENYQTLNVFLKHLEGGNLNLYEYDNGEKKKWLYIEKEADVLQKLYVIRKDFLSEEQNQIPTKIDTLATTESPEPGLFRFEKKFKITLRDATKDVSGLAIPDYLEVNRIRKFVKQYNKQKNSSTAESYFEKKAGFRFFLTGNYFAINPDRTHYTGTIGEEVEFLFNSERKRTTLSIGFAHRAKVSEDKFEPSNNPFEEGGDIVISKFYIRANSYLNIQNQFKPFFFSGINATYAVKGERAYNRISNFDNIGGNSLLSIFNIGIGSLYEFKNGLVIKGEVGSKYFPDCRIGIGWTLDSL